MKKRRLTFLAMAILATSSIAALSQSTTLNDSGEAQQPFQSNCTDPVSATDPACTQNQQYQQRIQQQGLQQSSPDGSEMERPRTLGTGPTEDISQRNRDRTPAQQQRPNLPPEQPTEFQKFVAATIGQLLPIYGATLFRNVPSTFAPVDSAPVTSDYVIGPEDELRIHIWGQINYSGNLRVDRSGNINLPQIGTIQVAGLQFVALDQHLRQAVARTYRNFDLSVDVGRTRSMQVYVTGQARRPGVYTISSLSSLVNALFASGGPSEQGSLRHILVNRGGATIADFDLYSLLVHGDKSRDVRLLPEDVLYIPTAGPQVAITGSVRSPAIYELRAGETIADLIEMAGKTTAMSSDARISLERVEQPQLRQAMEFKFDPAGLATPLADGDILRIFPILPSYEKTVTLRGNVANPGRFGWHPGMRLSDLVPDRESLLSRDYWWKRSHLGLPVPEFESAISALGKDQRSPGSNGQSSTAPISQENLTAELLPNAQQDPYNPSEPPRPGQTGNTGSSIASQLAQNPAPGSSGQPRRYDVRLSAPEINWDYAVIERLDPETLKSSLIPFDLGKLVIDHDSSQDIALQPSDTITVFSQSDIRVPLDRQTKYIELEGEFVHAGIYSVQPGETLRDVAQRAGGLTQKAYLFGAEFTRESTRLLQQQRIDEYARTVSMEAERGTQALAMSTPSGSAAADVSASRMASQELSTRLSQIRATGRIVLQFHPDSSGVDDIPAMSLENGDRFVVPFVPSTVNVVGAVYDQNSFLFDHGRSVIHYLEMAGGPNRNADSRHAFVIRADGSVVSRAAVKGASIWTNSFNQIRLNPGDTIVVPDKTLRPSALRGVMDWTQIFSQLALGAAAINVL